MLALLQQSVTPEQFGNLVTQLNEATRQTSYSTVSNIVFMLVVLGLFAFFIYNVVGTMRTLTGLLMDIKEGIALLLDRRAIPRKEDG